MIVFSCKPDVESINEKGRKKKDQFNIVKKDDKLSLIKSATSNIIHFHIKLYIRKSLLDLLFNLNSSFHDLNQLSGS